MSATTSPSLLRALARLLPFVRPALPRLVGGVLIGIGASLASLLIPLVLQWAVDGPISSGDRTQIVWATLGVLGLGIAEAALVFLRRQLVLRPSTEVEFTIRQSLYERL